MVIQKMKFFSSRLRLTVALSCLFMEAANAHSVFFEPTEDGQLIARFAQFGDDPETSPGFLDSLEPLAVWTLGDAVEPVLLTAEKKSDCFEFNGSAAQDAALQTGFPITTRGGGPVRKPYFYARWTPGFEEAAAPAMTLDIVPTGAPGQARVFFRNQPLAGVELTLFTPEANDQDLVSDENGVVQFHSDEKGLFMLKVGRHRESRVGFFQGEKFDAISHNCSLTWVQ